MEHISYYMYRLYRTILTNELRYLLGKKHNITFSYINGIQNVTATLNKFVIIIKTYKKTKLQNIFSFEHR